MQPDAYLPYYGSDFEQATKGWRREVKWSYLAAIWHYWKHTHAEGLPNDDDQLRLICDCTEQDWARTKGMIFCASPFFFLQEGKWHQKRSRELWVDISDTYTNRLKASRAGVAARQPSVLPSVEPTVEPLVNQSESESESVLKRESRAPEVEIPNWKEFQTVAEMSAIPEATAKACFDHYQLNNLWLNQHGRLIDWRGKLVAWAAKDRQPKASPTRTDGAQRVQDNQELQRVSDRMKTLKDTYGGHQTWDTEDKAEFTRLRARKLELKAKLGIVV